MELVDTHAHLEDDTLRPALTEVLARAKSAGVTRIVAVGTTVPTSLVCCELAETYPEVFAAVGIHPNYCLEAGPDDWGQIREMASRPRVVALGETGIDGYWGKVPLALQVDYFRRHLQLSRETGLPVVVHMRDSGEEILDVLHGEVSDGPLNGVMHSFAGDQRLAETCLSLGLYVSFAGMVTFKKSATLRQVATCVPDDRILVETDSPYLSPEPLRGRYPNEPARVLHIAECLAAERGVSTAQFATLTTENALRLFRMKGG